MNCHECNALIGAYLEGELDEAGVRRILEHTASCPSCREVFESHRRVGEIVGGAFYTATSPSAARTAIVAKLADVAPAGRAHAHRRWWQIPAAAAAGLIAGAFICTGVQAMHSREPGAPADMVISKLEGTVLQKHRGATVWEELAPQGKLYVGDDVQTLAGSRVVFALKDESIMSLEPGTSVNVKEYNGKAEFVLSAGSLRATLTSPHPPFAIRTPQGLIRALGTDFAVTVE